MPETPVYSQFCYFRPLFLRFLLVSIHLCLSVAPWHFAPCLDTMSRFLMFTDLLIRWCLSTQLFDNSQWCILDTLCVSVSSVSLEEICPAEGVQTPIAVSLHELESRCQGNNKRNYTWVYNFFLFEAFKVSWRTESEIPKVKIQKDLSGLKRLLWNRWQIRDQNTASWFQTETTDNSSVIC